MGREKLEKEAELIQETVSEEVLASFNEHQLWAIYMALDRAAKTLVKPLAVADKALAEQFYVYGKGKYGWF